MHKMASLLNCRSSCQRDYVIYDVIITHAHSDDMITGAVQSILAAAVNSNIFSVVNAMKKDLLLRKQSSSLNNSEKQRKLKNCIESVHPQV